MEEPKKTYGQIIHDHYSTNPTIDDDVIEYRKVMEQGLVKRIYDAPLRFKNLPQYRAKDFYIVCLFKVERIGQAVRDYVFARMSCPSPIYKQAVWKYHRDSDSLEYLWTIPDQVLYWHIYNNPQKYLADKETKELAQFVMLMESGELLEWIIKENGEKPDVIIRNNKEAEC